MSEEFDEKQRLEDQMRAVMDKYKYKRRQIRELQEDLGSMQNTLGNLTADEQALVEVISENNNRVKFSIQFFVNMVARTSHASHQYCFFMTNGNTVRLICLI